MTQHAPDIAASPLSESRCETSLSTETHRRCCPRTPPPASTPPPPPPSTPTMPSVSPTTMPRPPACMYPVFVPRPLRLTTLHAAQRHRLATSTTPLRLYSTRPRCRSPARSPPKAPAELGNRPSSMSAHITARGVSTSLSTAFCRAVESRSSVLVPEATHVSGD